MASKDEDCAIAASIVKFLQEQMNTLSDESRESLNVAVDCINTVYGISGSEKTVPLRAAYGAAIRSNAATVEATPEQKQRAEELKNKGNTHLKDGELLEAIDAYSKAIELDGNNAVYYSNRAAVHLKLGNNQGALDDCDRALTLDPKYSKAHCRKGVAHMNKEENERAKDCFLRALELEPGNETYQNNLKAAQERLDGPSGTGGDPFGGMFPGMPGMFPGMPGMDPTAFLNNPAFIQMATRVMQDPSMQQMLSSVMGNFMGGMDPGAPVGDAETSAPREEPGQTGDDLGPDFSTILRVGQQLAQQMASANPELVEQLRRQGGGQDADGEPKDGAPKPGSS